MFSSSEFQKVNSDNYINYGQYLTSGGPRRIATLAPQVQLLSEPVSSIPRPIKYRPPKVPGVAQFYPSYQQFGVESKDCQLEDFYNGKCGQHP